MPKKEILLLDSSTSPWKLFLEEFLEDTQSSLRIFSDSVLAGHFLTQNKVDLFFIQGSFLSLPVTQKIKAAQLSHPDFRAILIGDKNQPAGLLEWDLRFPELPPMLDFQKQLIKCLPLPAQIQVLVIDDELEVGTMIQEYFENRSQPSFKVVQAFEGGEGLERIQQSKPDIIILDIKMPKMGGREFYQQMLQKKIEIPVVVFFDAILGDELEQICRMGKLMVVEKGSKQGSPPELISVIEKAIFFS